MVSSLRQGLYLPRSSVSRASAIPTPRQLSIVNDETTVAAYVYCVSEKMLWIRLKLLTCICAHTCTYLCAHSHAHLFLAGYFLISVCKSYIRTCALPCCLNSFILSIFLVPLRLKAFFVCSVQPCLSASCHT